jgi:hypothetical protein
MFTTVFKAFSTLSDTGQAIFEMFGVINVINFLKEEMHGDLRHRASGDD